MVQPLQHRERERIERKVKKSRRKEKEKRKEGDPLAFLAISTSSLVFSSKFNVSGAKPSS